MPPFVAASALSNALQFVARHWRIFAIGAFAIACFIGFQIIQHKLDKAEQQLEASEKRENQLEFTVGVQSKSIDSLQGSVDRQNDAIDGLATEGNARIQEGQAAILEEVRRGAKANTVARELTEAPTTGNQSKTSARVLANKDLL